MIFNNVPQIRTFLQCEVGDLQWLPIHLLLLNWLNTSKRSVTVTQTNLYSPFRLIMGIKAPISIRIKSSRNYYPMSDWLTVGDCRILNLQQIKRTHSISTLFSINKFYVRFQFLILILTSLVLPTRSVSESSTHRCISLKVLPFHCSAIQTRLYRELIICKSMWCTRWCTDRYFHRVSLSSASSP